jgi:hypothetical protein
MASLTRTGEAGRMVSRIGYLTAVLVVCASISVAAQPGAEPPIGPPSEPPPAPAVEPQPPAPTADHEVPPPPPRAPIGATPAPVIVVAPPEEKALCIEGKRAPFCTAIMMFEMNVRFGTTATGSFDMGVLGNTGAHGFGLLVGWEVVEHKNNFGDTDSTAYGVIKGRYRRWLGDDTGIDFSVGAGRFGGVAEVALQYRDIIAITAGANTFPIDDTYRYGANIGVRLGSEAVLALLYIFASLSGGANG